MTRDLKTEKINDISKVIELVSDRTVCQTEAFFNFKGCMRSFHATQSSLPGSFPSVGKRETLRSLIYVWLANQCVMPELFWNPSMQPLVLGGQDLEGSLDGTHSDKRSKLACVKTLQRISGVCQIPTKVGH